MVWMVKCAVLCHMFIQDGNLQKNLCGRKKTKTHPDKKPAQAAGEDVATEQLRVLREAVDVPQHFAESGNTLCGKKGFDRWVHDTI